MLCLNCWNVMTWRIIHSYSPSHKCLSRVPQKPSESSFLYRVTSVRTHGSSSLKLYLVQTSRTLHLEGVDKLFVQTVYCSEDFALHSDRRAEYESHFLCLHTTTTNSWQSRHESDCWRWSKVPYIRPLSGYYTAEATPGASCVFAWGVQLRFSDVIRMEANDLSSLSNRQEVGPFLRLFLLPLSKFSSTVFRGIHEGFCNMQLFGKL